MTNHGIEERKKDGVKTNNGLEFGKKNMGLRATVY